MQAALEGLKNRVKLRADLPVVDEICRTVVVLKQRAVSNKSFAVNRTAGAEKLILPVYGVTDGDTGFGGSFREAVVAGDAT